MKRKMRFLTPVLALFLVAAATPLAAEDVWVADILANPARYWNRTVTVTGQVMTVTPNPAGTTRGTYTLLDDSTQQTLTVRSKSLPPAGQTFAITGVILQDPNQANVPLLNEVQRSQPGMSDLVKYLLIGGVVLFAILLLVFLYLLVKPNRQPVPPTVYSPPGGAQGSSVGSAVGSAETSPVAPAPSRSSAATRKLDAPPTPDKTQVFTNLGAELVVERGPDAGQAVTLHKQVTTIGRPGARKNDVELTDDTVSKEQASIYYDNASKSFAITNQSTTNPTLVNKKTVTESLPLDDGDRIEMGSTVLQLRFT
jgi:hypothetical protein